MDSGTGRSLKPCHISIGAGIAAGTSRPSLGPVGLCNSDVSLSVGRQQWFFANDFSRKRSVMLASAAHVLKLEKKHLSPRGTSSNTQTQNTHTQITILVNSHLWRFRDGLRHVWGVAASANNQYLLSTVCIPGTGLHTVHVLSCLGVFTSVLPMKKLRHRGARGYPVGSEPRQSDSTASLCNHYVLLSSKH